MHRVAHLQDIAAGRGTPVEIGELKLLLVRDGDTIHAYAGECPHAGAPLHEGAICDGRIICPWHKAMFAVADGALLEPPALDHLAKYPVSVDAAGNVRVGTDAIPVVRRQDSDDGRTMVIIGAGAAGTAAACALREFGFGGAVVLIGPEPGLPYDRTALSKFVMAGGMKPSEVPPLRPPEFFAEQRIQYVHAEATALDLANRRVELGDAPPILYDALLIATGARPKPPGIPGADLAGVHTLRSLQDAAAILDDIGSSSRAVILGSSFIGLEVASGLREQNIEVAIVAPDEVPFQKQFGPQLGAMFKALHEENGVVFHPGTQAAELRGGARVECVKLQDGRTLDADLVIAGIGVRPATSFITGIALAEDGGIPVDATMRAAERVYAAGDIARFPLPHGQGPARIEHWRLAQEQARVAARNMLGGSAAYDGVPFFWTYHYGLRFDYIGHAENWDDIVIAGDLNDRKFAAFFVREGHVAAVLACQRQEAAALLSEKLPSPLTVNQAMRLIETI